MSTLELPSTDRRRRAKLLLVDDTYANLVALTAILEPLDQDLVTARSGEEALRRLLDADFAAILLDVRMPGLDGFETATLIRKRERSRTTPIVFLTAHERDPRHVFDGYAHGAVDYLVKPYDADVLRGKVRALVELHLSRERERWDSEAARRRDKVTLERSNAARQQRLLDAVPHPIWIARSGTTIETANKAWMETIGEVTESVSQGFLATIDPVDRNDVERRWRIAVSVEQPFAFECRLRMRKGAAVWHLVRCVPEHDATRGGVVWVCTATDIGELRAAEETRDELKSILAHVVRPRVAALTSAPNEHESSSGERLLRFLDAVTVDPSQIVLQRRTFDLGERLRAWCAEAASSAGGRRIDTHLDGPIMIEGDPEQVERVVLHLLGEALGRTPVGEEVDVMVTEDAVRASLVIQDPGPVPSCGVPLRLARQVADRLGARVCVEAGDGKGTSTILELPRRRLEDTVPAFRASRPD